MSVAAVVLVAVLVLALVAVAVELLFHDRSGSLDDGTSGPIPHGQRRSPGPDSGQRRDHAW